MGVPDNGPGPGCLHDFGPGFRGGRGKVGKALERRTDYFILGLTAH